MSEYIPQAGHLMYATVRPSVRMVESTDQFGMPVTQQVEFRDNSYRDTIFRCMGRDDTMVVAVAVTGYWARDGKPFLFRLDGYRFEPVGPAVASSLNLTSGD